MTGVQTCALPICGDTVASGFATCDAQAVGVSLRHYGESVLAREYSDAIGRDKVLGDSDDGCLGVVENAGSGYFVVDVEGASDGGSHGGGFCNYDFHVSIF